MVKKLDNSNNKCAPCNDNQELKQKSVKAEEVNESFHYINDQTQAQANSINSLSPNCCNNYNTTQINCFNTNSKSNCNSNENANQFIYDEQNNLLDNDFNSSSESTANTLSANFVQYATSRDFHNLNNTSIPILTPGLTTIETNYQHQQQLQQHSTTSSGTTSNPNSNFNSTSSAAFALSLNLENLQLQNALLTRPAISLYTNQLPQRATENFHQILCQTCSNKFPTELQPEDEERLERIFKNLDRNGDGKIDVHDLSEALHEFGLSKVYAEKFMEHSDKNRSGNLGFAEFLHYVREHEKHLCLQFSHLDKNKDGKVDLEELVSAFKDLGLEVDRDEAKKLLARMDKDGSLNISYNEWRDFLLMAPSTDIHDLIKFWRHSTYLDIGEDMNVPDDFTQNEMQTGMWWRHLAAGGIAGAVSRTCTAPLDRVKVYLQVQTRKMGISECMKYMLNEGGVRSMWRGNGINIVKIAPESAIKFAAYEQMKRLIRGNENRSMSISERFVAGAAAGGISQTIIYPMEVLKTRLALRKTGQYKGIFDAAKKIYKNEGPRSFYRGYVPNILGILPYAGIDLAVYETLKRKYIASHANNEQPSFLVLLACGSMSSALGQLCSYPLALVRTRLQAQAILDKPTTPIRKIQIPMKSSNVTNEDTMVGLFRKILQTEGLTGLYRGITPNFLKVLPAVSISYVVYEYSSRALGIRMT